MPSDGTVVALTTSGLTLLASSYPSGADTFITAITSAADGTARGGAGRTD